MAERNSGPVDVMVEEVHYHGTWHLSGDKLKVSYGSWDETVVVREDSPPISELAKQLLAEIVDRDLTFRGRPIRDP